MRKMSRLLIVGLIAVALAEPLPPLRPLRPSSQRRSLRSAPPISPPSSTLVAGRGAASGGGCSIRDLVLQIVNNVAGAGILTLSAGMAGGVGWVPASILCVLLGIISGITFHMCAIPPRALQRVRHTPR